MWVVIYCQVCGVYIPYKNLKYKAQKFAMVLPSLDIRRVNGLILKYFLGRGAGASIAQSHRVGPEMGGRWFEFQLGECLYNNFKQSVLFSGK